jgi:hypothetical protein
LIKILLPFPQGHLAKSAFSPGPGARNVKTRAIANRYWHFIVVDKD